MDAAALRNLFPHILIHLGGFTASPEPPLFGAGNRVSRGGLTRQTRCRRSGKSMASVFALHSRCIWSASDLCMRSWLHAIRLHALPPRTAMQKCIVKRRDRICYTGIFATDRPQNMSDKQNTRLSAGHLHVYKSR
jgi:hypothetical protein